MCWRQRKRDRLRKKNTKTKKRINRKKNHVNFSSSSSFLILFFILFFVNDIQRIRGHNVKCLFCCIIHLSFGMFLGHTIYSRLTSDTDTFFSCNEKTTFFIVSFLIFFLFQSFYIQNEVSFKQNKNSMFTRSTSFFNFFFSEIVVIGGCVTHK